MRFLRTVFSFPQIDSKATAIRNWLNHYCYPYNFDRESNYFYVFNIPVKATELFIKEFGITTFNVDNPSQMRLPYTSIYRAVDSAFRRAINNWLDHKWKDNINSKERLPLPIDVLKSFYFDAETHESREGRKSLMEYFNIFPIGVNNQEITYEPLIVPAPSANLSQMAGINNYIVLSYRELPEIQIGQSLLGSEAFAIDKEKNRLIAFNMPMISIDHILECAKPSSLYVSKDYIPAEYANLFQYVNNEINSLRLSSSERIPFTKHLLGIDLSNFE